MYNYTITLLYHNYNVEHKSYLHTKVMGYLHNCGHATPILYIYSTVLHYSYKRIAKPEIFVTKNNVVGPNVDRVNIMSQHCTKFPTDTF